MKTKVCTKNYSCVDCGDLISRSTAFKGKGRCLKCGGLNRKGMKIKRRTYKGKNNPNYKEGKSLKDYFCDCGNKVSTNNGIYGSKTCLSCRSLNSWKTGYYNERNFKGKNNPNYINGLSKAKYSNKFRQIRILIRERDNFICQCCGMSERKHIKKFKEILHVHHIDYNKDNCKEDNLITTCKTCNLKANGNRDYWYAFYIYIIKEIIYAK